jgi:aldose 1-epimerase
MLLLECGAARCVVHPDIGGALGSWSIGDQNMLHAAAPVDVASGDPLRMSSFPLVPYSNRIGMAQFMWDGAQVSVEPNFAPEPHAIHGIGWRRRWDIKEQSASRVTLAYTHQPDANWPWAHTAEQVIDLTSSGLTLTLRARNDHSASVPLAFGHHPYFDAQGARLTFLAASVWMSGDDALPTVPVIPQGDFDFAAGADVQDRALDHCFAGWTEATQISWSDRPFALDISATPNLSAAVVYIPRDGDAFCFEPVPHINNALNMPDHGPAMPFVAPGVWFEAQIVMRARAI